MGETCFCSGRGKGEGQELGGEGHKWEFTDFPFKDLPRTRNIPFSVYPLILHLNPFSCSVNVYWSILERKYVSELHIPNPGVHHIANLNNSPRKVTGEPWHHDLFNRSCICKECLSQRKGRDRILQCAS